jgi:hypothetical protein
MQSGELVCRVAGGELPGSLLVSLARVVVVSVERMPEVGWVVVGRAGDDGVLVGVAGSAADADQAVGLIFDAIAGERWAVDLRGLLRRSQHGEVVTFGGAVGDETRQV